MGAHADLVSPDCTPGSTRRPVKVERSRVVDAISYAVRSPQDPGRVNPILLDDVGRPLRCSRFSTMALRPAVGEP